MTLLITVFAAVITTVIWYNRKDDNMKMGILLFMFWGASLMWFVDAVFEYMELRAAYFTPAAADMLNDSFLGLSVIALAMVVFAGLREQLQFSKVPKPFDGMPIALITAGLLALAFMGFSGVDHGIAVAAGL